MFSPPIILVLMNMPYNYRTLVHVRCAQSKRIFEVQHLLQQQVQNGYSIYLAYYCNINNLYFKIADQDDLIDETLNFFRANVLFRNFDVRGGADRSLIYLTLYTHQCLVKCEKIPIFM